MIGYPTDSLERALQAPPQFWTKWEAITGISAISALLLGIAFGAWILPVTMDIADLRPPGDELTAGDIAQNNMLVGAALIALGAVTMGVGAMVLLFLNGTLVGKVVITVIEAGEGHTIITGLLPHAGFEAAGFAFITMAAVQPMRLLAAQFGRNTNVPINFTPEITRIFIYIGIGLVLIVGAAYVEEIISAVRFGR